MSTKEIYHVTRNGHEKGKVLHIVCAPFSTPVPFLLKNKLRFIKKRIGHFGSFCSALVLERKIGRASLGPASFSELFEINEPF